MAGRVQAPLVLKYSRDTLSQLPSPTTLISTLPLSPLPEVENQCQNRKRGFWSALGTWKIGLIKRESAPRG